MIKPESVPQFVNDLFLQTLPGHGIIRHHAVERVGKAVKGNHRCDTIELGFPENERKHRNEEIDAHDCYSLFVAVLVRLEELCQQGRGVVLPSRGIECPVKIQRSRSDVRPKAKDSTDSLRNPLQPLIFQS